MISSMSLCILIACFRIAQTRFRFQQPPKHSPERTRTHKSELSAKRKLFRRVPSLLRTIVRTRNRQKRRTKQWDCGHKNVVCGKERDRLIQLEVGSASSRPSNEAPLHAFGISKKGQFTQCVCTVSEISEPLVKRMCISEYSQGSQISAPLSALCSRNG